MTQLYANQAIEIDEQRRDHAVSAAQAEQAVGCHWLNGCCVLPPGRVLTGSGEMFKVFTPFSRAWLKALDEEGFVIHRAPAPRGEPLPWQPLAERAWVDEALGELTPDPRWPVGEAEAQRRLNDFLEQAVLDYGETRDFPAIAGTSVISPIWRRASSVPVSVWRRSSSGLAIGPSPRPSPALSGSMNSSGASSIATCWC